MDSRRRRRGRSTVYGVRVVHLHDFFAPSKTTKLHSPLSSRGRW